MDDTVRDTVPIEELPDLPADHVFHREWATYRREARRLLAEGHGGKVVVIKGDTILGVFSTREEARAAGARRFLKEPFFAKELSAEERLLRVRGINLPCRVSIYQ